MTIRRFRMSCTKPARHIIGHNEEETGVIELTDASERCMDGMDVRYHNRCIAHVPIIVVNHKNFVMIITSVLSSICFLLEEAE